MLRKTAADELIAAITRTVTLYAFFGYCLLVIAAILALRLLVTVFRPGTR